MNNLYIEVIKQCARVADRRQVVRPARGSGYLAASVALDPHLDAYAVELTTPSRQGLQAA